MKGQDLGRREKDLLKHLGNVSKMMIYNHSVHNLTEFVLHDLCSEKGFNIHKAAYLVNNPDFYTLQGVAGYYHPESYDHEHWSALDRFSEHMQNDHFNKLVRGNAYSHFDRNAKSERDKVEEVADALKIEDPKYHIWNIKNNNHGMLIYEKLDCDDECHEHLFNYLHMLGHCPVF